MSISSDDDKSISLHSNSDDSRDGERERDTSPEVGPAKGGKGKKKGTRKPPARKTTAGKYLILLGTCKNTLHNGTGKCGNRKTKGEDLRGKHGQVGSHTGGKGRTPDTTGKGRHTGADGETRSRTLNT